MFEGLLGVTAEEIDQAERLLRNKWRLDAQLDTYERNSGNPSPSSDEPSSLTLVFANPRSRASSFALTAPRESRIPDPTPFLSSGPPRSAFSLMSELVGAAPAALVQAAAQERQRVAAQRQAGGGVVQGDGFALGGFEQIGLLVRALDDRRVGEQGVIDDPLLAGCRPELAATVAGQGLQGIGLGQRLQLAGIKLRAAREVVDAGEALRAPRLRQAAARHKCAPTSTPGGRMLQGMRQKRGQAENRAKVQTLWPLKPSS